MLTHHLADILNRVGLVLAFVSFWLAAPELIGEERLKAWEGRLASGLLKLPVALNGSIAIITFLLVGFFIWRLAQSRSFSHSEPPFVLVVALDAMFVFLWLSEKVLKKFVSIMATKSGVRQASLVLGAALFTASFLLQFLGTYSSLN
jgi:hypothetical protein